MNNESGTHTNTPKSISGENKSTLVSRNITVLGKRTSVRLEPEMWNSLQEIAKREDCKIHDICSLIQLRKNPNTSLTAAIRVFLMLYYRAAATSEGHRKAGHGDFLNMIQRARMSGEMLQSMSRTGKKIAARQTPYNGQSYAHASPPSVAQKESAQRGVMQG